MTIFLGKQPVLGRLPLFKSQSWFPKGRDGLSELEPSHQTNKHHPLFSSPVPAQAAPCTACPPCPPNDTFLHPLCDSPASSTVSSFLCCRPTSPWHLINKTQPGCMTVTYLHTGPFPTRPQVANTRPTGGIRPSTLFYLVRHLVSTWQQHQVLA